MHSKFFALLLPLVALAVPLSARADEEGVKLTREELQSFLPGTEVAYTNRGGSLHRWTNNPDGHFVASTDGKATGSRLGTSNSSGPGTWSISEDGKYCIQIEWKKSSENWCASIVKTADGSYYLNKVDPARKIEFTK